MRQETLRAATVEERTMLRAEQSRLLFSSGVTPLVTSAALATILAWAQQEVIRHEIVLGWAASIWLISAMRAALVIAYRRAAPAAAANAIWLKWFRAGVITAGMLWGLASFLLFPEQNTVYQMFLAFALAGVTTGAVIAYSVDLLSIFGFLLPTIIPFMLRTFVEGGHIPLTMGLMVLLFLVFSLVSVHRLHGNLRTNIALRLHAASSEEALRKKETDLRQTNDRLNTLIEAIPDAIFFKDGEGRWLITNEAAKHLFHLRDFDWQGKTGMELAAARPELHATHEKCMTDDEQVWVAGALTLFQEKITDEDGKEREFEVRKVPAFGKHGRREGLVVISRDVTEQRATEWAIHSLAFYDSLTGLPNRRLLLDRLQHALPASARHNQHGALLFIDLDDFKKLNDAHGHNAGDMLLTAVARRLSECLRAEDTVARLGGDEFVVLLEDLGEDAGQAADKTEAAAGKILEALNRPYEFGNDRHSSTPSIGISLFFGDSKSVEDLLKHADVAMYQAKQAGRNTLRFFDPAMQSTLESRMRTEATY
jgi:diguanylate cyclase (GGDEF)-like protein/PAS domain S-box-containing protein